MPFADICVDDREKCPNEWPALFFQHETKGTQKAFVRDRHGKPVDLANKKVCLIAKETFLTTSLYINADATIIDEATAEIEISLTCEQLFKPGLFLGELVVVEVDPETLSSSEESSEASSEDSSESSSSCSDSSCVEEVPAEETPVCDDTICYRARCYVEVSPNLSNPQYWTRSWGVLTVGEIRLAIRDKCREDNFLLDNVEFSDTEIMWAIQRPIEYWNETPPPLRPCYNATNFPYRYHWLFGVVGELLRMAGPHYERNRLRYSAAGLAVDDKDKANYYDRAGDKYIKEYREWVQRKKYSINVNSAFGHTELTSFGNEGYYGRPAGY